ncbi:cobyrinic acid A,C-diamide synthase [Halalkalibacter wakoensis JCM 9140]|uniref:Cobyrinate a,c-diamide synthase n=1 Tax=Halalkalibacter wakoensis JCM 9140 TaxID=1236970 RepID=W4PY35_9BACI|nr:cobyrinate a,c-diamide synthase [Halalkalibacter wakoensis]GAE24647.1 cobyrinic acid A,C-diamide synthase [Halalkalibacter wakoensis JCM 9140]
MSNRIVIAGTSSGVGKTTVTIGLMAAFKKRGLTVQGFKCGPDYIDPSYHTAVTERASRNLDSWMLTEETLLDVFTHGSEGADMSILEGVMGFFDGKNPENNDGSTADISIITRSPVILVVDCSAMARSAAAIVKGFQTFDEEAKIVGVIANKVGSEGHFQLVKTAVEKECNIPVIGYVKSELGIEMPERHLGLIPSIERGELEPFFDQLGELVSQTIDLDQLLELSAAESLPAKSLSMFKRAEQCVVRVAVAKDAAFNFYYPENLELMEAKGMEIVYFSPLANEPLPANVDGLYIGGGFPEEFAPALAQNDISKKAIKKAIEQGMPTLAECGGYMYLSEAIKTSDHLSHEMVGIIPGVAKMEKHLMALGYREVRGMNENFLLGDQVAKGHEYHYSSFHNQSDDFLHAYETKGMRGTGKEGYVSHHLVAGYTHFHFASCPDMIDNWKRKCVETMPNEEKI